MRFKRVAEEPVTYAVIFETGDEIAEGLKKFAKEQKLKASSFKAIGACERVKLGWFDWEEKKYKTAVELKEQVELLSMIGDVGLKDGESTSPDAAAPTKSCGGRFPFEKTTPAISVLTTLSGEVLEPQVHAHLVVGKRDGSAHGGHLLEARVRPTCEVILTESPEALKKEMDTEAGIALIKV